MAAENAPDPENDSVPPENPAPEPPLPKAQPFAQALAPIVGEP